MATTVEQYEVIENALNGMPEGLYTVRHEFEGDWYYTFLFARVDGAGEWWPLGSASKHDEERGYNGRLDTRAVSFDSDDELQAEFRRVLGKEASIL